ncbi:MAG: isoprenylcysteine carboxylmethyltransferase family protein [Bacteroidota bacterium]
MQPKGPSILVHIRDWMALPFVVTVIIPYFLNSLGIPILKQPPAAFSIAGPLLYVAGLSMQLYTTYLFWKFAQGTLAPWQPTQRLVIRGIYRYCRNPMITGVLFMLAGEALFFNARGIGIWTCMFFMMNTMFFIFKEEPDMLARFGEPYREYKTHVPRWIPRVRAWGGNV